MPESSTSATRTDQSPPGGGRKRQVPPFWVIALTMATFAFGTDDYVIAGVLPAIAHDLTVGEPVAGQLMTIFSLTYAIGAPVAAVLTAGWNRRRLLTIGLVVFALANLVAPAIGSYPQLVGLRVIAALAAATVVPAAFSLAVGLAPAQRQGRYLGIVMSGLTSSIVLGVPLGTWIGGALGWAATLVFVGVLGVVALGTIRATLPPAPGVPDESLSDRLAPLRQPAVLVGLAAIAVTVFGNMVLFTYLAPYVRDLAGAGSTALGIAFALAGLAGIVGGQLGGRASDRWGPDRALQLGVGGFATAMLVLIVLGFLRPVPFPVALPLLVIWAMFSWWIPLPAQTKLLGLAGSSGPQVLALNSSAVYVGVSIGGAVGGLLFGAYGTSVLPYAAAAAQLLALLVFAVAARLGRSGASVVAVSEPTTEPADAPHARASHGQ